MNTTLKLSLISAALLSQLNAQEITLQPLEITSTAIKTDELKSTDAVEIYTAKDIEKAHVQNLYEFLNKETSISTIPAYGNPFSQLIDMHGYGSSNGFQNVVITLDGRKLNNIDRVPQLLSSISPASISRIEIIKSSGIVLGGDGANAGVINITTKQSNDKDISFYMGTYGLVDGSFYVGHKDKKLALSASGEAQKSNGIRAINAAGDKDRSKFATGTFNLAYTPVESLELRLGANYSNMDFIYPGSLTKEQYDKDVFQKGAFYVHQKYKTSSINAGTTYDINDNLSFKADANHEYKTSDFVPSSGLYSYNYNSAKASFDYTTDLFSLSVGYDGFFGKRTQSGHKTTKDNNALFVMTETDYGKNTFKAGYRYEKVTYKYDNAAKHLKQDDTLNGVELGYNYLLNKQQSLFVNYTKGFKAPNIDSFFKADYSHWPIVSYAFNTFIDPMKTDSYTIGYNNIQANNKLKASIYYVALKDEIYLNPITYVNTNIDKSHKYGLDLYDKYIINQQFNVALNYNYVQAIIDEEKQGTVDYAGNKLPGVSDHNVKAMLNYLPNKRTTLSLTQVWRSEAYAANDFSNSFSQKQDAYNSTDIAATYTTKKWEVFAKINNLFNQKNGLWIKDDAIYPVNFTTTAMAGFTLKY